MRHRFLTATGLVIVASAVLAACSADLDTAGEHGGDPSSIAFCEAVGLDYVSCSPYRVPIARLAAAQAALVSRGGEARERDR